MVAKEKREKPQSQEARIVGIPVLTAYIEPDATLITDSFTAYHEPGKAFAAHEIVDHSKNEYEWEGKRTNTVKGSFSQLKRRLDSMHHHVSERHLGKYLSKFAYRYNTRKFTDGSGRYRRAGRLRRSS